MPPVVTRPACSGERRGGQAAQFVDPEVSGQDVSGERRHPRVVDDYEDDQVGFRADEATEHLLRSVVFPRLTELSSALPQAPPDEVDDVTAYAVAHGFYCRVARTARAALSLVDAGFGSEGAPLRRALLEHVLALAWVIDEGSAAVTALTRAHQARMKSIKELMDGRWSLKDEDFEGLLAADVPSQGQDHLAKFGQLVQLYDVSNDLLIAWLSDTGESHPSFLTARAYWHDGGSRLDVVPDDQARNDVRAIGFLWWLGACEMDRLTGWGKALAAVGAPAGLPVVRVERKKPPLA